MLDAVRQAVVALADAKTGILRPEDVIEAARSKSSPLHDFFTWDNRRAADAHRLNEARSLIRQVTVEVSIDKVIVQAPYFIRDPSLAPEQGYRSLGRLRNDEDLAREAILAEFQRAVGALRRAKAVAAALGMREEIEEVELRLNALVGRATSADARA